jgi:uncharacterized membrane protein YphA (DoxX/SURF4 family)
MNVALWICQGFLAVLFVFSGVTKATLPPAKLVAMGQTGVEGLPAGLVRCIGISEILGAAGVLIPWLTRIEPVLTPVAAACLGLIMLLAANVHYRRAEVQTAAFNLGVLAVCLFVTFSLLGKS